jgi:hypothetical protein
VTKGPDRRLMSDDELSATAMWYMRVCIAANLSWEDMSPLEVQFFKEINKDFEEWLKNRRLH